MARVVTKGSKANVRAGAAPTAPVVGSRSNGDQVDVLERKSGWVRIGTNQWISGELVHEEGAASADGEVTPLKALPGWPDGRVLRAFGSGSADLKGRHKQWLDSFAIPRGKAGQRIWICGLTSRLGGASENQQLSEKRAEAVRDYLVKGGVPLAKIIGYVGQGEARAGGSATNDNPLDRAVMVCVTNDVIQLPTEYVTGRRLFGPIKWTEVNPSLTQLTLAGKTDTPASSRGDAVGMAVTFLSNTLQDWSLNGQIEAKLKAETPVAERLLPADSKQGILAVMHFEQRQATELNTVTFRGGAVVGSPQPDPKTAIDRYQNTPQLEPGQHFQGKRTRRYFWGVREGAK